LRDRIGRGGHARSLRRRLQGRLRGRGPCRIDLSLRRNQCEEPEDTLAGSGYSGSSLMLIPSIDLQNGAVVQLVQGERLAIRDDDIFKWVRTFERFPKVQVIDLDAAMGRGDNLEIVRQIAPALSCRVGGGIRTVERAKDVLAAGAKKIIA